MQRRFGPSILMRQKEEFNLGKFKIVSPYQMAGDQPAAVRALVAGVENGLTEQTLLGVTGSGLSLIHI